MVELGGAGPGGAGQHSFDNSVFILPAIVIVIIVGKYSFREGRVTFSAFSAP